MPSAILITGFNNWGKSTLIRDLFHLHRFDFGTTYRINNVNANFAVESHSNDDYSEATYVARLQQRLAQTPSHNNNLLCAFCPTREPHNDSKRILHDNLFNRFDDIYLFFLVFKWDHHAELIVPELQAYYANTGVHFVLINADATTQGDAQRLTVRLQQAEAELRQIFP